MEAKGNSKLVQERETALKQYITYADQARDLQRKARSWQVLGISWIVGALVTWYVVIRGKLTFSTMDVIVLFAIVFVPSVPCMVFCLRRISSSAFYRREAMKWYEKSQKLSADICVSVTVTFTREEADALDGICALTGALDRERCIEDAVGHYAMFVREARKGGRCWLGPDRETAVPVLSPQLHRALPEVPAEDAVIDDEPTDPGTQPHA